MSARRWRRRAAWGLVAVAATAVACAEGSTAETEAGSSTAATGSGGGSDGGHGGAQGDGGGGSGPAPQSCPPGELAVGLDASDTLVCEPLDAAVHDAVNTHCSLYFGWRDSCDGCTSDPAKWGRVSGSDCENGLGADSTCAPAMLLDASVTLFGLNTDGDVGGDDKFYAGMRCEALDGGPTPGPCAAGELLAGIDGGEVSCVPLAALVAQHVNDSCRLYFGWSDSCDGCTSDPAKWGRVSSGGCELGAGADNSCTVAALGEPIVQLFGLNTDGDVGGDDKLFIGMTCTAPEEAAEDAPGSCPPGMAVAGINDDGSLACSSPLAAADQVIASACDLYLGWRDGCDGCTTAPAKWGQVSREACANGTGADNTCTIATLGGEQVRLFGLNPDGDMDGNDKLYLGFQCR